MQHIRSSRGFSLVELMIAVVLGLILIAGVIQVFLGNRQTQLTGQAVARVQESGRLGVDFIEADLRQAGFYGTGGLPNGLTYPGVSNLSTGYPQYNSFANDAIRVYSKSADGTSWSPSTPPSTASSGDVSATAIADAKAGSDLIVVYYAYDTGAKIATGSSYSGTDNVTVKRNTACFEQNELAMLSSSAGSVIFKVTNTPDCSGTNMTLEHEATGNSSDSLGSNVYDEYSRVMKIQHRVYYVGDTGRTNSQGGKVWALYRSANGATPEELVEGIEYLKLAYGERLASGNIHYGDASSVSHDAITTAQVGVLAQGLDAVRSNDDATAYTLPGGFVINKDGSGVDHDGGKTLRRVFTANVELRNRAQ